MDTAIFNEVKIELKRGDIVKQADCDAIVNAANAQLRIGGGVAGAIHRAAGKSLTEETRPLAPIKPGEAVITGGHALPNRYIIHCLGPVYGRDEPSDELLRNCYTNALMLADEHKITSIAFPAISTGAFGYPVKEGAKVALNAAKDCTSKLEYVTLIRFVLWGKKAYDVFDEVADSVFE